MPTSKPTRAELIETLEAERKEKEALDFELDEASIRSTRLEKQIQELEFRLSETSDDLSKAIAEKNTAIYKNVKLKEELTKAGAENPDSLMQPIYDKEEAAAKAIESLINKCQFKTGRPLYLEFDRADNDAVIVEVCDFKDSDL